MIAMLFVSIILVSVFERGQFSIGQIMFGYFTQFPYLFILYRFISGVFAGASLSLFMAEAIAISNDDTRVKYVGALGAASILGSSFGYKIGGMLDEYGFSYQEVFLFQIIFGFVVALLCMIFINKTKNINKTTSKKTLGIKNIFLLNKKLLLFLITLMFIQIAQINITKYLDVLMTDVYNPNTLGDFVLATAVVGVIGNFVLIPLINKHAKEKNISYLIFFQVVSMVMIFVTFTFFREYILYMLYTTFMFYMIAKTLTVPLETNEISKESTSETHGIIFGARQSFLGLGQVLGPLFGGALYEISPYLVFYVSSLLFLVAIVLLFIYKRKYGGEIC